MPILNQTLSISAAKASASSFSFLGVVRGEIELFAVKNRGYLAEVLDEMYTGIGNTDTASSWYSFFKLMRIVKKNMVMNRSYSAMTIPPYRAASNLSFPSLGVTLALLTRDM